MALFVLIFSRINGHQPLQFQKYFFQFLLSQLMPILMILQFLRLPSFTKVIELNSRLQLVNGQKNTLIDSYDQLYLKICKFDCVKLIEQGEIFLQQPVLIYIDGSNQQNYQMKSVGNVTFQRTLTNNTSSNPNDKRRVVSHLQNLLKQQVDRRQTAQNNLYDYRQRSLFMEKQFTRLLEKYDSAIAAINGRQVYTHDIYQKLIGQIENFTHKSQNLLDKRCEEIVFMMSRRVSEIVQKAEIEIQKQKKLSEEEYKLIKQEIKEALKIAKGIEQQNQQNRKINSELIFKNKVLAEERNLLVQQLCEKKLFILKITKNKQFTIPTTARVSTKKSSIAHQNFSVSKFICEPYLDQSSIENPQLTKSGYRSARKQSEITYQTANHFKITLQREKRKCLQLKNVVAALQNKSTEVYQLIENFNLSIESECEVQQKLKKYEKLIESIKLKTSAFSRKFNNLGLTDSDLTELMTNQK